MKYPISTKQVKRKDQGKQQKNQEKGEPDAAWVVLLKELDNDHRNTYPTKIIFPSSYSVKFDVLLKTGNCL